MGESIDKLASLYDPEAAALLNASSQRVIVLPLHLIMEGEGVEGREMPSGMLRLDEQRKGTL